MVQGTDRNPNYPPSEVDLPHLVSTLPSPQGDTGRSPEQPLVLGVGQSQV